MTTVTLVAPGPMMSTYDVFAGLSYGLSRTGLTVRNYLYHNRVFFCDRGMKAVSQEMGGISYTTGDVLKMATSLLVAEVLWPSPSDWVLFVSGTNVDPLIYPTLRELQALLGKPKIAVYFTEVPYVTVEQQEIAREVDMVFINDRACLEEYRELNPKTYYLPHSYHPLHHYPRPVAAEDRSDVLFIGTLYPERVRFLESVDWTGIRLKLMGHWPESDPDSRLAPFFEERVVANPEAARLYCGAKIVVNFHRRSLAKVVSAYQVKLEGEINPDRAFSVNPRCFEVPACGALLLTDHRPELDEIYATDRDLVVYRDLEDFESKLHYYLDRPDERREVALRGWWSARPYNFEARARQIARYLTED